MKITREINGEEITIMLTLSEVIMAHREAEKHFDAEDIRNVIDEFEEDEEEMFGDHPVTAAEAREQAVEIGLFKRKYQDKGMHWYDACVEALKEFAEEGI